MSGAISRLTTYYPTCNPPNAIGLFVPMKLTKDILKQMLRAIANTRPDELSCDECFERLDEFAEQMLAGKDAEEAMPLVKDHLNRCTACREEFEALLEVLQATTE